IPDAGRILGNGAVAGELSGTGHVDDRLTGPHVGIGVQLAESLLGLGVRRQVRQVPVVVAPLQQGLAARRADPWLIAAEVIFEDQVEGVPYLRFVLVVPERTVPTAAALHLFGRQPEEEEVLLAGLLRHLDSGSVARANRQSAV